MPYLDTLRIWMQSTGQIILVALFVIGFAAMAVTAVHSGLYTRQQKNAGILAFVVAFLVVASIVVQAVSK